MKNKKLLVVMLFLLPLALFSYEISFNKKFSKTVAPNLLSTNINVVVENEDENFINKNIGKFSSFIKKDNSVNKKNGSYSLSPKYRYYKDKQEFQGYVGSLRYTIDSGDAKKLNKFLDKLVKIKQDINSRKVKLTVSNVTWNLSDELYEKSLDKLRIKAFVWIETYANSLENSINKQCSVKNININSVNRPVYYKSEMVMADSSRSFSNAAPIRSSKDIKINPNFVLECE